MTKIIIEDDNKKELIISTILSAEEIKKLIKMLESAKQETLILSETSLKKDWLKPEEDEAWKDL